MFSHLLSIQSIVFIVLWCKWAPFSLSLPIHTHTPLQNWLWL